MAINLNRFSWSLLIGISTYRGRHERLIVPKARLPDRTLKEFTNNSGQSDNASENNYFQFLALSIQFGSFLRDTIINYQLNFKYLTIFCFIDLDFISLCAIQILMCYSIVPETLRFRVCQIVTNMNKFGYVKYSIFSRTKTQ